ALLDLQHEENAQGDCSGEYLVWEGRQQCPSRKAVSLQGTNRINSAYSLVRRRSWDERLCEEASNQTVPERGYLRHAKTRISDLSRSSHRNVDRRSSARRLSRFRDNGRRRSQKRATVHRH